MKVVTTRVEDKVYSDIMLLRKVEKVDQAELVRRLLARSIAEEKLGIVLERLRKHEMTYRKAAEFAGVAYVELLKAAEAAGIEIGYSLSDLKADMARL